MSDETKKTAPKENLSALKILPSLEPKLGRVYSNFVQVSSTKLDFTIRFGDAPPGGDLERLTLKKNEIVIPNLVEVVVVPDLIPEIIKALDTSYKIFLEQFKGAVKEDPKPEVH